MSETATRQTILVNETKEEYAYDAERALRIWHLLLDEIPAEEMRGYSEYAHMSDEDRIIGLFELLNDSQLGDIVFGSLANFDQGSTLIERGEDE